MSSNQPQQQPDNQAAPFHRPYPTYVNHINNLLRGRLHSENSFSSGSSVTSPTDTAPFYASTTSRRLPPRVPPGQTQADQRRHRLIESMMIQYPPNTRGIAEIRAQGNPRAENLKGFSQELEGIVGAKQEKTKRYEEFHVEWTDLQKQLQEKADELRAKYATLVEQVRTIHHDYIRDRIKENDYITARTVLTDQMEDIFGKLGQFVITLGTIYAESRAVAQGANPTGDFNYGKLDVAACTAVPFLIHNFPEFVKKKPSTIPPDPFGPRVSEMAFKDDLPSFDFHDMMASVWNKHPTKLQDIHQAVFKEAFAGIKELTQKEKDNVNALLGNGGEWSL